MKLSAQRKEREREREKIKERSQEFDRGRSIRKIKKYWGSA